MSQPAVTITELDGALGVLPASSGDLLAFVGPATSGPIDTPATFARSRDVVSSYGSGPTVEAAAYYIERYGRPIVFVRSTASNPGVLGVLDDSDFTGTSIVTLDVAGVLGDRPLPTIELRHGRAHAEFHVILARAWARDPHLVRGVAVATTRDV